jgi:hypothetical protein
MFANVNSIEIEGQRERNTDGLDGGGEGRCRRHGIPTVVSPLHRASAVPVPD